MGKKEREMQEKNGAGIIKALQDFNDIKDRETRNFVTIEEEKLETQDRVNISLRDYEKLKKENASLKEDNKTMKRILDKLSLPYAEINPDSVRVDKSLNNCTLQMEYRMFASTYRKTEYRGL